MNTTQIELADNLKAAVKAAEIAYLTDCPADEQAVWDAMDDNLVESDEYQSAILAYAEQVRADFAR
jgi:hypothetical protein